MALSRWTGLLVVVLAAATGLVSPCRARADAPVSVTAFRLKEAPAEMIARVVRQSGVADVEVAATPDGKVLFASGSAEAVKRVGEIVKGWDRPMPIIDVTITASRVTPDGVSAVVGAPHLRTLNNQEASIKLAQTGEEISITVTPRLNGDDTITLDVDCRDGHGSGAYTGMHQVVRRPQGQPMSLLVPDGGGKGSGLRFEVAATRAAR